MESVFQEPQLGVYPKPVYPGIRLAHNVKLGSAVFSRPLEREGVIMVSTATTS